jgi:hypothetical protein
MVGTILLSVIDLAGALSALLDARGAPPPRAFTPHSRRRPYGLAAPFGAVYSLLSNIRIILAALSALLDARGAAPHALLRAFGAAAFGLAAAKTAAVW